MLRACECGVYDSVCIYVSMFLCDMSVTVCVVCISVVNIFLFLLVFRGSAYVCANVCVCIYERECVYVCM